MKFEKYERVIIIFLTAVVLSGIALSAFRKSSGVRVEIGRFDFLPEELDERRQSASNTPVNINTAGLEDLMRLKRVGKVLAQRIIDYRSSKGRFRSKEDIKNVKGIGDGLFEEIKKSISVE